MDTPRANALKILQNATAGDTPPPLFLLHENGTDQKSSWKLSDDENGIEIFANNSESSEIFLFLSHNFCFAQQIEAILSLLKNSDDITMGRLILFIHSPLLLDPHDNFLEWLDGISHFTDVMLFIDRSNHLAGQIKKIQERYRNMHFPMESYILGKKNNPWSKILDFTPRRISHIFDEPELLENDDLPENDRYLMQLPNGERKRVIPLIFKTN